ncbi:MAG: protein kinase, partial [Actinomycetes bacterium]
MAEPPVEPPQQVYNDRYEPLRLIARGGMAEVWLARDALLDRNVALKVLFPELSVDRNFVERFRREAQAAANLTHPNIVSVYDWGEAGNTYFIVMEYVDGRPLSAVLHDDGPMSADRAAGIGADVAAALGFAHRNGVIHRDVKPGNVLITSGDQVKVTDFGIARAADTEDHLTQTGAVMGTATYFSPEQAQGLSVDQRSDVYSLGVVLYEMVAGRPPFAAASPVAVAYKHVHEEPPLVGQVVPELPAAFEAIVHQAMSKDVTRRYATAEELRADLLRFRQGRQVLAEPVTATTGPANGPGAGSAIGPAAAIGLAGIAGAGVGGAAGAALAGASGA